MSIPPLVCSTPPPPEQCEDDKDHEDFDITYNLSQEDDDEDSTEYNYGNYSGYNIFPSKAEQIETSNWTSDFNKEKQKGSDDILISQDIPGDVNLISNDTNKFDDNILEDLNLKVNTDNVHSNDIPTKEYETEADIYNNDCSDKNSMIQDQGGTDIVENIEGNTITSMKAFDSENSIGNDRLDCDNNDTDENTEDSTEIILEDKINAIKTEEFISSNSIASKIDQDVLDTVDQLLNKDLSVDEFEDFDEFQFTPSNATQTLPANNENPWDNNVGDSNDFGDFRANFDDSNENRNIEESLSEHKDTTIDDCDDEFGDFDDFKSVNNVEKEEDKQMSFTSHVPVLSFNSAENELQIVDSINNVLTSIFTYEIPEPENDLDGKLELFLNETWGHLVDIDVRQPYIINWNNSLGQKTLLKALCIDSRNILFGPKWNYNMPRYATNLSAAPLQPQKQVGQSTTSISNTESTEKVPNKDTATWIDPFTTDGQESCSKENDIPKTETTKQPMDSDVFGSDPPTNLNKIYSSTINVQQLRHINLPDTHIFTPTDSETPRSKTIHYDSGPSLVPQPTIESSISQPEQQIPQSSENDNDYWEFQDFKGTTSDIATSTDNKVTEQPNEVKTLPDNTTVKTDITYQSQILQPIKLEPIIPTLNWPDPGEVKETFEDFSDFISNSSLNDKDNTTSETDIKIIDTKIKEFSMEQVPKVEKIEDEFEIFQSAPISNTALDMGSTFMSSQNSVQNHLNKHIKENYENIPIQKESHSVTEKNNIFLDNKVSGTTPVSGLQDWAFIKPNNSGIVHNHINSDILQPTNSNIGGTIRNHHNTGQILQPLSLESYSQINWPNPGIDLQDLSRFNPMNSLDSLKCNVTTSNSKIASPAHNAVNTVQQVSDDDIWGDFVSSVPKNQITSPKKNSTFADDDEWTDFVSSPSIKPQNGLNTISLNVHTNSSLQKAANQNKFASGSNQIQLDIPTLNYITPKSNSRGMYTEKHFQNL